MCIFSILVGVLALCFPTWKIDNNTGRIYGLFQHCGQLFQFSNCSLIHSNTNGVWFEVVRGVELVSVIIMFLDVFFLCKRNPCRIEGFDAFFIGLLLAVGPAVYGYYFNFSDFGINASLSWGFIVACFSPGLAIVGSFCMCGSEYTPVTRVEPFDGESMERRREKKKTFSPKDWDKFPDSGSHVEKDYYNDYYRNHDPYVDDYLHKY
ncbi:hypothetical protein SNE40_019006 [Patella caerulea]